jgi:Family of unknown function (DUF6529)
VSASALDAGLVAPQVSQGQPSVAPLLSFVAVGGAIALAAGVYSEAHTPTYEGITTFGFRAVLPMKAWLTTAAATVGIVQVATAMQMWGRVPSPFGQRTVRAIHRWSGTIAFLLTVPVAYHCLWALGLDATSTRTLVHGIAGCAFYGAFVTKMLMLRSARVPSWSIPVIGALLVAVLTLLWLTSSLWFFTNVGFPGT